MISSMTGFGRGNYDLDGKKSFTVEVKSINHRYLDINIKMPRLMLSLEDRVRKLISANIKRGKIDIFITYNNYEKLGVTAKFNDILADSYFKCLKNIGERYSVLDDISVSLIAKFPDVVYVEEDEENLDEIWNTLSKPLLDAVNSLKSMRQVEGQKLAYDVAKKCDNIKKEIICIENRADTHVKQYKEKLSDRLKEILGNGNVDIDENRISMELAIYADKCSIDEEITRLKSHIGQIEKTLKLDEPIGRKLDFIVQEINREANTIASKSNDLDITNSALNIKNEIEKIREQIQNIE
ncbi:YicC family protein [Clostridium sp. 19966]|uniref:YicC/YloC family endoribonuclease n=1 Tax=Clostridium sp. 19966 TaxID=2768166 RepID=UPI0028DE9A0B|nr:YicC/YloC family endoribonuclease [Clostridium sp. 19966]MDT8716482.1 YicC family protein [Clostridium sp. 19966]